MGFLRALVAVATAAWLLAGVVAPHHHAGPGASQDCVACSVGSGTEARDATPSVAPPAPAAVESVRAAGHLPPVTGAPLGAVPGQSPPASA